MCRSGETGRRTGLKIPRGSNLMSVRFRPPAPIFCKSPTKRYVHMKKHLLQVVIEQDEDGTYVADCPALKGCYAQGNTFEEAIKNIKDVIKMCLEELKEE